MRLKFDCCYAEPAPRRRKPAAPSTGVDAKSAEQKRKHSADDSASTSGSVGVLPISPSEADSPPLKPKEEHDQFWSWIQGQADPSATPSSAGFGELGLAGEAAGEETPFTWGASGMDASPYSFCLDVGLQPALDTPIDGYAPVPPVTTDQEIINHYILNTSAITKIRDSLAPNLYLGLFVEGMNNPLLYNTLLAFSTVHHAQWSGQQSLLRKAKERQLQSHAVLMEALALPDGDVDKLLPAILMGLSAAMHSDCTAIEPVTVLLNSALQLLRAAPPFHTLPVVTQRSAYVIAAVDVRLQLFGLGSGAYTRYLVALNDAPENSVPGLSGVLHVNLFLSRVAALDLRIQGTTPNSDFSEIHKLATELILELNRNQEEFDPPSLDPYATLSMGAFVDIQDVDNEAFNQLFIAGIYHSACIYLYRVVELVPALASVPPLAKTPAESALRILYMAMYTSKIRETSQAVWPRPFFFAALELRDPVHFDFMLRQLRLGDKWASAIEKTIQLLLEVKASEVRSGARVNVRKLMEISTGPFIM
ncbi:hypothetical protein RQP46_011307 [Phenoliferia psychrophenolica]